MPRQGPVVAVDLGTECFRIAVAEGDSRGHLVVLGVGTVPSAGFERRQLLDESGAVTALAAAKVSAERNSGCRALSAFVGLPASRLDAASTYAKISSYSERIGGAQSGSSGRTGNPLHLGPAEAAAKLPLAGRSYMIASAARSAPGDPASIPVAAASGRDVLLAAVANHEDALHRLCARAGLAIDGLIPQTLAAAEAVLTAKERAASVLLVDVGAGGTELAFYQGDHLVWADSVPIGGRSFTSDLAIVLDLPIDVAEDLKLRHGRASSIPGDATLLTFAGGDGKQLTAERHLVHDILEARVEQFLEVITERVGAAPVDARSVGSLVFTGGGALLPELIEVAAAAFGIPARVGAPRRLGGRTGTLSGPAHATVAGIARLGLGRVAEAQSRRTAPRVALDKFQLPWSSSVTGWLRELLQ